MMDQHREEAEALDLVIEHRQRAFVEAWDRFMLECEARAFAMLNRIQQRHITEVPWFLFSAILLFTRNAIGYLVHVEYQRKLEGFM
ncbi:hypothetical protein FOZ60_004392 [Perkinsus olseni]|uniref:Uncharacterized protein n=1 Tax=Perkinsus olseni TaxID=32597 RepID=A0A7J6PPP1_PEROL|nr:hypothetical protein FOZ60_004392 [Perkinsus olseni]